MRKLVLLSILLVFVMSFGFANAQDGSPDAVDPSGVTITYWHEWDGAQGEGMDQIIANFNATNEWGIVVEQNKLGSSSAVADAVSASISSGDLPNITGNAFLNRAQGWYLEGVLVPLDAYVSSEVWGLDEMQAAAINSDVLDINRSALEPFDSQLLAWPVGISAQVMPTNLTLLAYLYETGAISFEGVPTTWDQFREAACAAANLEDAGPYADMINNADLSETRGFAIGGGSSELVTIMLNFGGDVYDAEADAYVFTDDNSLAALQYVQDLYNDGCAFYPEGGSFANTNNELGLGFSPFATGSSVGTPFINGSMMSAGVEFDWVNVTMPWVEGERTLVAFLRGVSVLRGTPEENLASWLFIKYWATDPEAQRIWTESAQYQPYNFDTPGNLSADFLDANPQYSSFADVLADPEIQYYADPAHPQTFSIFDVISELYANITIGEMDVAEAAAMAEERANEIYEEALEELE